MSTISKAPILVFIAILAAIGYFLFAPGAKSQAPDFSIQTLKGDEIKLSDYRGRPVLITFWATTCPSCIEEIPDLVSLHQEFAHEGLEVIGIAMSYDPPVQVQKFVEKRGLPYTIALDYKGLAAMAYKVRVTPTNILISPQGHIEYRNLGVLNRAQLQKDIRSMLDQSREKLANALD